MKSKKAPHYLYLLFGLVIIILSVFAFKLMFQIFSQNKSGKILYNQASEFDEFSDLNFYCFVSQLDSKHSFEVKNGIEILEKLEKIFPGNKQSYFMLGNAYCLQREYLKAIEFYDLSFAHGSNNPNVRIEKGFAYFALANSENLANIENTNTYNNRSNEMFLNSGINIDFFTELGDYFFDIKKTRASLILYSIAEKFSPIQQDISFRKYLLQLINDSQPNNDSSGFSIPILKMENKLIVNPDQLYGLIDSKQIPVGSINGNPATIIYASRNEAFFLVSFSTDSTYITTIQVVDSKPAPTDLQLSIDFSPVSKVEIKNGNNELVNWQIIKEIKSGIHLFSIKLLNDSMENELDRNGYISQIIIEQVDE